MLKDSSGDSHDLGRFFEKHAIDPKVGNARRYECWTTDNPEPVFEAWPLNNRRFAERKIATRSDGLIIHRYPPEGLGLPHVYAELRPDDDVLIDKHHHWHGTSRLTAKERKGLKRKWIHSAWEMRRHIDKPVSKGGHGGENVDEVHPVEKWTHYVFPKGQKYAKRIDANPLANELFRAAERIYFGLEGSIKGDAMHSAILETGEKASVMSVASVTLTPWRSEDKTLAELELIAESLMRGRQVIFVPDADWADNWMVYRQAMLYRSFLRARGVDAHVAAPPIEEGAERDEYGKLKENGVDDYLAAGGKLEDLVVIDRPVHVGFPLLAKQLLGGSLRRDSRKERHAPRLLEALAIHSGIHALDGKTPIFTADGSLRMSLATTARILGMHPRAAQRTMSDLNEDTDAIVLVEGSARVAEGWHRCGQPLTEEPEIAENGRPVDENIYWQPLEYMRLPTYQLHKNLRPGELTKTPLREMDFGTSSARAKDPYVTDEPDAVYHALWGREAWQRTPERLMNSIFSFHGWLREHHADEWLRLHDLSEDDASAAFDALRHKFWPSFRRDVQGVRISLATGPMTALAKTLGLNLRTTYRLQKHGEELVSQSVANRENLNAANVIKRIEQAEARLSDQMRAEHDELHEEFLEAMRADHEELVRVMFAFRHGETPVEAWERVLAEDAAA